MLFLPAAGQMNGEVYDGDGTWAGMSSSTGVMLQLYVPGANRSSGQRWWAVSTRHSIRLASVVSELTRFIGKHPARLAYEPRHARLDRASQRCLCIRSPVPACCGMFLEWQYN